MHKAIQLKEAQANQLANNILVSNLRYLMQRHNNVSETEVARQTGIPQPTVHKILAGNTNDPRFSTLKSFADFFNTTIDELFNPDLQTTHRAKTHEVQSIPLISWQEPTKGVPYLKSLHPNNWEKWITIDFLAPNAYALTARPSMESLFPKGTILIIDPNIKPKDGDLVVVHYEKTEAATLRELSIDGLTKLLLPLSPNTPQDTLNDNIHILGVVAQTRFSYHA